MIKFKTIRSRIFITLTVIILLSAIAIFVYLLSDMKTRTFKTFDSVNQTINKALVANIREHVYNKNHKNMKFVIDSIESKYIQNILILDVEGNVIAAQKETDIQNTFYNHFEELEHIDTQSIKKSHQYMILNTFDLLDVTLGYLVVEGNTNLYLKEINEELDDLILLIISLFLIALFITFYLSERISRPLHNIINTLQSTKENETLKFEHASEEEFKYLIKTIEEKHNGLLQLNTTLEDEVTYKTKELQDLNETLEQKVDEAVKDIHTKEQLLQQQSRLAQMGEMISMIAHQWRQPLAAINSILMVIDAAVETDKFDLSKSHERNKFLEFLEKKHEAINNNVQHLSTTTDDFRNFFNPHTKKENIHVSILVEKALQIIHTSMRNNGIDIITDFKETKECELYHNEIIQVILNILKNANDALIENEIENKQVIISTYNNDTEVIIEICDNAGGIPDDIVGKIFDPYFSTKIQKNGTGLGLYMSKTIVEEHHNGKIKVKTHANGTCFELIFSL